MKLWTINRVLRWTGFRVYVGVWDGEGERTPTRIGIAWSGLPGSKAWAKWEPHNPTPIRALFRRRDVPVERSRAVELYNEIAADIDKRPKPPTLQGKVLDAVASGEYSIAEITRLAGCESPGQTRSIVELLVQKGKLAFDVDMKLYVPDECDGNHAQGRCPKSECIRRDTMIAPSEDQT